jgi:hypothetical protein
MQKIKPTPPPEVAGWVIERPTPEMLEEARRTFDEAEYMAAVREIEQKEAASKSTTSLPRSNGSLTAPPEPTARYRVEYSNAVKQRLRELSDVAIARGDGTAYLAALKDFVARLPTVRCLTMVS